MFVRFYPFRDVRYVVHSKDPCQSLGSGSFILFNLHLTPLCLQPWYAKKPAPKTPDVVEADPLFQVISCSKSVPPFA